MKLVIFFTVENDDGEECEHEIDARYEVCGRCQGYGKHSNPSIDGNGITSSEWAEWSCEEQETYMSGGYDVTCHECSGLRVVLVPDEENADKGLLALYYEQQAERARWDAEDRATRRLESGGYDY